MKSAGQALCKQIPFQWSGCEGNPSNQRMTNPKRSMLLVCVFFFSCWKPNGKGHKTSASGVYIESGSDATERRSLKFRFILLPVEPDSGVWCSEIEETDCILMGHSFVRISLRGRTQIWVEAKRRGDNRDWSVRLLSGDLAFLILFSYKTAAVVGRQLSSLVFLHWESSL